jgi:hypothetical protein
MRSKAILASGLMAGLLAVATPAQAGSVGIAVVFGDSHHQHHHGGGREAFRVGYERGQERGFEQGVRDARHGRFDYARDNDYRRGDRGYRCEHGPRSSFVSGYREGYEQGYRRGFRSAQVYRHRHGARWCSARHDHGHRHDSRCERDGRCDRRFSHDDERNGRWERDDDDDDWRDDERAVRRCDPRDECCER